MQEVFNNTFLLLEYTISRKKSSEITDVKNRLSKKKRVDISDFLNKILMRVVKKIIAVIIQAR